MKQTKGDRDWVDALPAAPVVILCRPQIGENVGAAARAMLNFGLRDLRLVKPECGWPNAKAVAMASGATVVLNEVQIFDTFEAATADLHHLYATTARLREMKKPVVTPGEAMIRAKAQLEAGHGVGLVFGAERTGLENEELVLADALVRIQTNPDFSSLNLAQAVLLIVHEWGKVVDLGAGQRLLPKEMAEDVPATKGDIAGLLDHMLVELEAVDFFKSPQRRVSLGNAVKLMIERRGWTQAEVNLMRGIVREIATGHRPR
ncbi:RNA methyltransferase [Arboricoccus pini]|nr:RNA methyltransferase [Arboricoccus pini]